MGDYGASDWKAIAERLARSLGHHTGCSFRACTCRAAQEQRDALYDYQRAEVAQLREQSAFS